MGLLDEVFPKKKETSRNRTVRTAPKKDPDKLSSNSSKKTSSTQSNVLIFGSLRRGQGVVANSAHIPQTKNKNVKNSKEKSTEKEKEKRNWFRSPSKTNLKKEVIKASAASLNVGSNVQKSPSLDSGKQRPISGYTYTNVTFRKGQNAKIDGQGGGGDNLSRTSSITNLDEQPQKGGNKGAKPRKSSSRDRLDKIAGEVKKNDKKGVTRNNNKLESGESPYPSIDSLQEEEFVQLRRQLQEMAQEKSNLAVQLGEQKGQLNILQKEIQKLKSFQEESNMQLEHLTEENTMLRNRLRDVAHSPLSDNEKQQLLFDSHRHHNSAPASIATNLVEEGNGGDVTTCTTPDWDKHSSSNVSEVSVACLQDKINQMQETHYSTNEELQATLQELTDLQRQLTELQQENERLNEEKTLMFDSLCRQTERLNDSRSEVESLKQLLYQEKDDTGQFKSVVEREQKLVDLLKSAQEERENLMVKLEQINGELQEARGALIEKDERILQLSERIKTLECTLDAKYAEHKLLDQELAQAKDQCNGKQIEINRLTDLLDNARTKINELEQDRALSDKSELDELLDNARKEKDALESEVAHLKEQLAISKNETEKLKEQVLTLQEEVMVTRNNAKSTQSDLEYKCEKLLKEKTTLTEQLQEFQEALNELQVQSQCQLEDKRQLSAVLSETQRNLSETERKNLNLEREVEELKKLRAEENEEWEKFQNDLLTSVRVANDFKTEAQQELQRMILENKTYRDRERQLKAEIEKLKGKRNKDGSSTPSKNSVKEFHIMDSLVKRPNKPKPRKSKENIIPAAPTPNSTSNVKRRERKPNKRMKTLSIEEEILLSSLDDWYNAIENKPSEENLTEEEKIIRKLKVIYEDEQLKMKPIAPKPKDQLAISKPLLDSVLSNPKLKQIITDPKVKTIEDMRSFEVEAPEIKSLINNIDRLTKSRSEEFSSPTATRQISIIGRSMSYDQTFYSRVAKENSGLYRSTEAEDLTKDMVLRRISSVAPSDSISNLSVNLADSDKDVSVTSLDRIVSSIPRNISEKKLTKEQTFARKLKTTLDEFGRKPTLKKLSNVKDLKISTPTNESVLRNPKLKQILKDPTVKRVYRRNSDTTPPSEKKSTLRQSKSYDDIIFSFSLENDYRKSSSSLNSFSSGEFNVEAGLVGPYDENSFTNSKPKVLASFIADTGNEVESSTSLKYLPHKENIPSANLESLKQPEEVSDRRLQPKPLKRVFQIKNFAELNELLEKSEPDGKMLEDEITDTVGQEGFREDRESHYLDEKAALYNITEVSNNEVDANIDNDYCDLIYKDTLNRKYETDEESDLTYNETLNKNKKESNLFRNSSNLSKSSVEDVPKEAGENVEESSKHEYDYHAILRENKYGVVSPLHIRFSYKDVVKEIKTKFINDEDENDSVDQTDLEQWKFLNDFFNIKQEQFPLDYTESSKFVLDKETEEIVKKYLHTKDNQKPRYLIEDGNTGALQGLSEDMVVEYPGVLLNTNETIKADPAQNAIKTNATVSEERNPHGDIRIMNIDDFDMQKNIPTEIVENKECQYLDHMVKETDITQEYLYPCKANIFSNADDLCERSDENSNIKLQTDTQAKCYDPDDMEKNKMIGKDINLGNGMENVMGQTKSRNLCITDHIQEERDLIHIESNKENSIGSTKFGFAKETLEKPVHSGSAHTNETGFNRMSYNYDTITVTELSEDEQRKMSEESYIGTYNNYIKTYKKQQENKIDTNLETSLNEANEEFIQEHVSPRDNNAVQTNKEAINKIATNLENAASSADVGDETESSIAKLDREMNEIFEKYLHTSIANVLSDDWHSPRKPKKSFAISSTSSHRSQTSSHSVSLKNSFHASVTGFNDTDVNDTTKDEILLNKSKLEELSRSVSDSYQWFGDKHKSSDDPVYMSSSILKPLPLPRSKNQATGSTQVEIFDVPPRVKDDIHIVDKMTELEENFSEHETENVTPETSSCVNVVNSKEDVTEVPGLHESNKVKLDENKTSLETEQGEVVEIRRSEKFFENAGVDVDDCKGVEEQQNLACGADTSYSTIAVAGKVERLDLTKHSELDIDEDNTENESHLNLFHLETPSFNESYLDLFKASEKKAFEEYTKKRVPKSYVNLEYLSEPSDTESADDIDKHKLVDKDVVDSVSKPKIIDFVPLDDATKPVFNKNTSNESTYDTLERETAFHVLTHAASTGSDRKSLTKIEALGSCSEVPSGSRSSFTAARKVFEALVEANSQKKEPRPSKCDIVEKVGSRLSSSHDVSKTEITRQVDG